MEGIHVSYPMAPGRHDKLEKRERVVGLLVPRAIAGTTRAVSYYTLLARTYELHRMVHEKGVQEHDDSVNLRHVLRTLAVSMNSL